LATQLRHAAILPMRLRHAANFDANRTNRVPLAHQRRAGGTGRNGKPLNIRYIIQAHIGSCGEAASNTRFRSDPVR
jgi:hypothetical protein